MKRIMVKNFFEEYRGISITSPFISKAEAFPEFPQQNFLYTLLIRSYMALLGFRKSGKRVFWPRVKTDKAKLVENE